MAGDVEVQTEQVLLELGKDLRTMIVPLWTIWYTGLILLGCATGLLTMSSSLLRKQLEGAYQVARGMEEEEEEEGSSWEEGKEKKEHSGAVGLDSKFDSAAQVTAKPPALASPVGHGIRERGMMVLLVLALFSSQIKLFHWILRAQSWAAYQAGMNTSLTTWLLFGGLISGTAMISFGLRCLPRPLQSLSYTDLD